MGLGQVGMFLLQPHNSALGYYKSQFALNWLHVRNNPSDELIGLHAVGNLIMIGNTGVLKLVGKFINTAYSNADYNDIVFGVCLNTINSIFGKNFTSVLDGNWTINHGSTTNVINLYESGAVLRYALIGSEYCASFGRIYTIDGDFGALGVASIPPGYVTAEIYLK